LPIPVGFFQIVFFDWCNIHVLTTLISNQKTNRKSEKQQKKNQK